jgi:hypothetical protein
MDSTRTSFSLSPMARSMSSLPGEMGRGMTAGGRGPGGLGALSRGMGLGGEMGLGGMRLLGPSGGGMGVMPPSFGYPFRQPPSPISTPSTGMGMSM